MSGAVQFRPAVGRNPASTAAQHGETGVLLHREAELPAVWNAHLLALAVLQQAVHDAYHATLKRHRTGGAAAVTQDERDEALRFLQAADGGWAMARRAWCDMAGVEPGWLERQAPLNTWNRKAESLAQVDEVAQ